MSFSYSKVECHNKCPYLYKLRYIDHLKNKFDESPTNALHLGSCIHEGIESRDVDKACNMYRDKYSIWGDDNDVELEKIKIILPIAFDKIPDGEYEYELKDDDGFIGYIDLLEKVSDGVYNIYDFKYSNSASKYRKSGQIHLYKYYFEKLTGNKINKMYYVLIPKSKDYIDDKNDKKSILEKLNKLQDKQIRFEEIEFDRKQINFFFARKALMDKEINFEKRYNNLCLYCQFKNYCKTKGEDRSEIEETVDEGNVTL